MRVLVTGAAGFIGSNLALSLVDAGHSVVGLDNFSSGHFENLQNFSGDVVAADLAEPSQWENAVGNVEAIFHEAAITDTTVTDQMPMMRVNVEAFRALLKWAAAHGVKSVVYATSAGVYGDGPLPMRETAAPKPLNIYAFSKRVMEVVASEAARENPKMQIVGLRYFNVFGPGEKFKGKAASMIWQLAQQMKTGKPRIFEHGTQYRDFIYVRDVVQANLNALRFKAPSGVYNVCTGRKTTFNEIIAALNATLGLKRETEYFKNPYSFYQDETLGDPAKAEKGLRFSAKFTMAKAIEDYFSKRATAGVGV